MKPLLEWDNSDKTEVENNIIVNENSDSEQEKEKGEVSCLRRFFGPVRSGSLRGSTIALASVTFGAGCLAFPNVIAQTGPVTGLIIFIIVAACSYYTIKLLLDEGVKTGIMDYNSILEHAMGRKMVIFSDINNMILCVGVIMSYMLTVYKFSLQLGNKYFDIDTEDKKYKLILMGFCYVCIQIPLAMLRNISKLQYASIIGTIALVYSIVVIVIEMPFYFRNYIDAGGEITWFEPVNFGYLDTFATFIFGFSSHNGVYQIFMELKRPSEGRFNKVLNRSFTIEIILYLLIAFGGFFSTFKGSKDIFLDRDDLPGFNDYFIQVAKITLFICLHCTMAINYNILRMSFKSLLFSGQNIPFWKDFFLVIFTYLLCNVLVFFISDVTQILGVIGGFCTIVICFINPVLIHVNLSGKSNPKWQNYLAYLIMIVVTIIGSASTIKSLMVSFLPKEKK